MPTPTHKGNESLPSRVSLPTRPKRQCQRPMSVSDSGAGDLERRLFMFGLRARSAPQSGPLDEEISEEGQSDTDRPSR